MKIRVVGSPLFLDTFTALGANPTQMSWADAQPALASGAVDGQENPLFLFTVLKMHTSARSIVTTWGYVADPLIFVVNKDVWDSLDAGRPGDRAPGRHRRRQAGDRASRARAWSKPTSRCSRTSPRMGVTVTQLTPAERDAFVKATRPVYAKWKAQIGAPLVDQAEKAIAARRR